jgi:hypothetical protein
MRFIKDIFVTNRFFYIMGGLTLAMMLSHAFSFLMPLVQSGLLLFLILTTVDAVVLFHKGVTASATRETGQVLSLAMITPLIFRCRISQDSRSRST